MKRRPLSIVLIIYLLAIFVYMCVFRQEPYEHLQVFDGSSVIIAGVIDDKEVKGDNFKLHLKNTYIRMEKEDGKKIDVCKADNIIVYFPYEESYMSEFTIGSNLTLQGNYMLFDRATNEGEFDAKKYWAIRKYSGSLFDTKIIKNEKKTKYIPENLWRIKQRTKAVINRYMSSKNAGSLCAILLGDKTSLDPDTKNLFSRTGIAHILSLSGLHIASIGLCIYKLLRRMRLPLIADVAISLVILLTYSYLTGMSTSTLRALIMYAVAVIADVLERSYDLLSAMLLSCVLILCTNPCYISDSGFQLSFLAVAGIGIVKPVLSDLAGRKNHAKPGTNQNKIHMLLNKTTDALLLGLSISLTTLPVTAFSFFGIPVMGFMLNIIVVPLLGVLLAAGFAGAICGQIGFGIFEWTAGGCFKIADAILELYGGLAGIGVKADWNFIVLGRPTARMIVIYYMLLAILVIAASKKIPKNIDRIGLRHLAKAAVFAGFVLLIPLLGAHKKDALTIRNIDVGQGDAIAVWGKNTPAILIDGGSSDNKNVGTLRIGPVFLANGISAIDYCFITHPDNDHVSGILDILEDNTYPLEIKRVVISKSAFEYYNSNPDGNENLRKLFELCKLQNIPVCAIGAEDNFVLGNKKLEIGCLNPYEDVDDCVGNESSLVLVMRHKETGFKAVFTGDIGSETESVIENKYQTLIQNADYLKVAHHGSKNSSSESWLLTVNPKIAVISVGEGNSYGHPNKETLERFDRFVPDTKILRTDKCGQVTLKINEYAAVTSYNSARSR